MQSTQVLNLSDLEQMNLSELRSIAQEMGMPGISNLKKQELIFRLLQSQAERQGNIFAEGVLEIVEAVDGRRRGEAPPVATGAAAVLDERLQHICDEVAVLQRERLGKVSLADLARAK